MDLWFTWSLIQIASSLLFNNNVHVQPQTNNLPVFDSPPYHSSWPIKPFAFFFFLKKLKAGGRRMELLYGSYINDVCTVHVHTIIHTYDIIKYYDTKFHVITKPDFSPIQALSSRRAEGAIHLSTTPSRQKLSSRANYWSHDGRLCSIMTNDRTIWKTRRPSQSYFRDRITKPASGQRIKRGFQPGKKYTAHSLVAPPKKRNEVPDRVTIAVQNLTATKSATISTHLNMRPTGCEVLPKEKSTLWRTTKGETPRLLVRAMKTGIFGSNTRKRFGLWTQLPISILPTTVSTSERFVYEPPPPPPPSSDCRW